MSTDYPRVDDGSDLSRKECYEKVLRFVEYQTGGPDMDLPSMMDAHHLWRKIAKSRMTHSEGRNARRAAIENGDLLRYNDRYALVEEDALQDIIESEVETENPDRELIGKCNSLLSDLRSDSE